MSEYDVKLQAFLEEITRASNVHGIGIEGGTLFVMEPEDLRCFYVTNGSCELLREERREPGIALLWESPN